MNRPRLRTIVTTVAVLMIVAVSSWYFAPSTLGGNTRYVVTSGVSMEPRFHTGDLALIRAAHDYKVGQIVAYWSTMLHTVVLHRIHAIHGNTYLFKGDNNDFIDPNHPTRAELLGKLWWHIPHAGRFLDLVHRPLVAALFCALVGGGLLVGVGERKRRRRRRSGSTRSAIRIMSTTHHPGARPFNPGALFIIASGAVLICLALAVLSFTRASHTPSAAVSPYTQQASFGYSAHVARGPVYPNGTVNSGDPIFVRLVHRLEIHVAYQLTSAAPATVEGTEAINLRISGPSGWHREMVLTPRTRFTGNEAATDVALDIPQLESLLTRIGSLIGPVNFGNYSIAVVPHVDIKGTVAGQPINSTFEPALAFQLQPGQLQPSGAGISPSPAGSTGPPGSTGSGLYTTKKAGSVSTPAFAANRLGAFDVTLPVFTLRWLSVLGLVLCAGVALVAFLRKRSEPFEETFRIQAQYGHMIVPIVAGEDLGWPAVDVANIKALVKLAESGQRLILHSRSNDVDSYMVNDEGTVYRYQVKPSKVVWGDWSEPPAPLQEAA